MQSYNLFVPCSTARGRKEFDLSIEEISKGFTWLRYRHEMKEFSITGDSIYGLTTAVAKYVTEAIGRVSN